MSIIEGRYIEKHCYGITVEKEETKAEEPDEDEEEDEDEEQDEEEGENVEGFLGKLFNNIEGYTNKKRKRRRKKRRKKRNAKKEIHNLYQTWKETCYQHLEGDEKNIVNTTGADGTSCSQIEGKLSESKYHKEKLCSHCKSNLIFATSNQYRTIHGILAVRM